MPKKNGNGNGSPPSDDLMLTAAVRQMIKFAGDDPDRNGLIETPARVIRSYHEMFAGYRTKVKSLFKTFDEAKNDEMIVVRDIDFMSFCEHHLLPIIGLAHVAYIPSDKRVIGLSKIPRVVDAYAKRLQIQERLTTEIAEAIMEYLKPLGAGCVIEAKHLCMCGRGVSKKDAAMVTSCTLGVFREKPEVRAEFLSLVGSR